MRLQVELAEVGADALMLRCGEQDGMKSENKAKVRAKDPNALTESELAELKRLRKENADLKTDREILFEAAAFFARETDR